jgi:glucokinase
MRVLGADLGGHFIKAALVEGGAVAARETVPTPESRSPADVIAAVAALASRLDPERSVKALGVGFPGMLDSRREKVLQAPNFPLMVGYPFRSALAQACGREVALENDAHCAALGEWAFGAAKDLTDFVLLTLGTGIGGAIVSGGRLVTGAYGKAGELGHLAVAGDAPCGCGALGHAEALFGADALGRAFSEAGIEGDRPELWLRRGEPRLAPLWEKALDALARLIASVSHALDPQAVILGGGLSRGLGLVETLRPLVLRYTAPPFRETFDLRLAALGDDAALLGSALGFALGSDLEFDQLCT